MLRKLHKHGVPCGKYQPLEEVYYNEHARENHFLDCEAMAYAAAYMLGVPRIADSAQPRKVKPTKRAPEPEIAVPAKTVTSVAAMARLNMGR